MDARATNLFLPALRVLGAGGVCLGYVLQIRAGFCRSQLAGDAFALSDFPQASEGSGSVMLHLRNLDRQQAGSYSPPSAIRSSTLNQHRAFYLPA